MNVAKKTGAAEPNTRPAHSENPFKLRPGVTKGLIRLFDRLFFSPLERTNPKDHAKFVGEDADSPSISHEELAENVAVDAIVRLTEKARARLAAQDAVRVSDSPAT